LLPDTLFTQGYVSGRTEQITRETLMDVMDVLRRSGGVEAIAKHLGVPPAMAAAGAEALLPAVLGGFQKHSDAAGGGDSGLGGLIGMLGGLGGGGLAANVLGPDQTDTSQGDAVLGQIFGSKDVSRTVAGHAATQTGLDPELLKQMLPILAMLVGGYISARAGGSGTSGGTSGGIGVGSGQVEAANGGGGLGSLIGALTGGAAASARPGGLGGLGALVDLNHNGNPLDDILGMAGKLLR
jgi:hypothetical protein